MHSLITAIYFELRSPFGSDQSALLVSEMSALYLDNFLKNTVILAPWLCRLQSARTSCRYTRYLSLRYAARHPVYVSGV